MKFNLDLSPVDIVILVILALIMLLALKTAIGFFKTDKKDNKKER